MKGGFVTIPKCGKKWRFLWVLGNKREKSERTQD